MKAEAGKIMNLFLTKSILIQTLTKILKCSNFVMSDVGGCVCVFVSNKTAVRRISVCLSVCPSLGLSD